MGVDAIEIIMEVESAFGLSIKDAEAERCPTAGGLFRLVLAKLADRRPEFAIADGQQPGPNASLSDAVLCHVLEVIRRESGEDRAMISGDTAIAAIIPRHSRRNAWRKLAARLRALQFHLPPLILSSRIKLLMAALTAGAGVVTWTAAGLYWSHSMATPSALLVAAAIVAAFLSPVVRSDFPRGWTTFHHLAHGTVAESLARGLIDASDTRLTRHDVWLVIQYLIATAHGIRPEMIAAETNYVDLAAA